MFGRASERAELDRILAGVRTGVSAALVVRGEAGIGKSALLDYAAACADGLRVLRGVGVESEAELPFSALHLLLRGELGRVGALPAPQAAALRGALGLASADGRDRFLIGLAVLSLLAELAEDAPVLCLVDDAQWLDRASAEALLFAARRLGADKIGMVLAARAESGWQAAGLPELWMAPLPAEDAADMIAALPGAARLPLPVRDQVLDQAQGNPLALIELARALGARGHAVPVSAMDPGPVAGRVLAAFQDRIGLLPEAARTGLSVVAADDTGDLGTVLAAAGSLGAGLDDLRPAEDAGLIELGAGTVRFRHPLVRAAAYQGAPVTVRFAAHRVLSAVFGAAGDVDRRAWHLAAGAIGLDEETAAGLAAVAAGARARGGQAAAATAYERSAQLSPDAGARGRRLAAAAQAAVDAGLLDRAGELADQARSLIDDPGTLAELAQVRAAVEFERGSPRRAARIRFEGAAHAPDREAEAAMLVEAVREAWYGRDEETAGSAAARLAELAPAVGAELRPLVDCAIGLAALLAGDGARGWSAISAALREVRSGTYAPPSRMRLAEGALVMGDDEAVGELASSVVAACRDRGVIAVLPLALLTYASALQFLDRHDEAQIACAEALSLSSHTGQPHRAWHLHGILARIAAVAGDEERCREHAAAACTAQDSSPPVAWARCSLGLLELGLGRMENAFAHLESAMAAGSGHTVISGFAIPDHVEAAVATGRVDAARRSLPRFADFAAHCGQPWAAAVMLRCRALLASPDTAEEYFAAAVRRHREGGRPLERARTELLYGEWLRRERRRAEALTLLRSASQIFERVGAAGWAARAREQLRGAGEGDPARELPADPLAALTPQERQVVRLAATGLTNREVAAQLFLSHRTVGFHLNNAFPKLGIASRTELTRLALEQ
ncbi:LuxR C-terminal-related transcriptional regulator [Actinomadura sp. OS1-43]|uniref:ATP-binding protein n=1 Tax=Actinomadura sp. OS1-43 TaxID=604315 RepID=UPI00255B284D|nr:helix-turn-helix transcriptional regulator [Actinomadura sp. OS1-43]MDL4817325.1 LuxR C-terminal-related transcriptional regulator [Actinomadura sp. OS1-43]